MADEQSSKAQPSSNKTSIATPKTFKPRAGIQRKSKAERDKALQEEQERQQARVAATLTKDGVSTSTAVRGTKAGRGRGGIAVVNKEERVRGDGTGGGVFGAGSGVKSTVRPKRLESTGSYSEILEGQEVPKPDEVPPKPQEEASTTKVSGSGTGSKSKTSKAGTCKPAETIRASSEEDPDEPKRDIERIWISSDEEDLVIRASGDRKGKQKQSTRVHRSGTGLRPVRAPRSAVEDDAEDKQTQRHSNKPVRKHQHNDNIHDLDADEMDMDEPEITKETPSSPELKKKTLKKGSGKGKDARSLTETNEDRAERLRVESDIQKLRREFPVPKQQSENQTDTGDSQNTKNHRDGKMILFQFPPLTPFLVDPSLAAAESNEVKQEPPSSSNTTADIPPAQPSTSTTTTAATTTTDPSIKPDPDKPHPSKPALHLDGLLTASKPTRLPSGYVGKLRVHKSGKVTLDWGGTDMEVRYGTEVDFLQDVVLVETPRESQDQDGAASGGGGGGAGQYGKVKEEKGTAFALGQVQKKMVVIPDWTRLYD